MYTLQKSAYRTITAFLAAVALYVLSGLCCLPLKDQKHHCCKTASSTSKAHKDICPRGEPLPIALSASAGTDSVKKASLPLGPVVDAAPRFNKMALLVQRAYRHSPGWQAYIPNTQHRRTDFWCVLLT